MDMDPELETDEIEVPYHLYERIQAHAALSNMTYQEAVLELLNTGLNQIYLKTCEDDNT